MAVIIQHTGYGGEMIKRNAKMSELDRERRLSSFQGQWREKYGLEEDEPRVQERFGRAILFAKFLDLILGRRALMKTRDYPDAFSPKNERRTRK